MTAKQINSLGLAKSAADTRVVVAMSGGVDSSATAGLLQRQGYQVIGVTLQLYDHGEAIRRKATCCAGQDIHDAKRVAAKIGIPHYVLDYQSRFKKAVIDDFADSYLAGETPIPCVRCNERIKFRDMFDMAKELNADVLATGHYIDTRQGPQGWEMHRALDPDRDQSYFLFTTTREQLDFLRFPLGRTLKAETRKIAQDLDLEVAAKPDSQDICFVPSGKYTTIIDRLRPQAHAPGEIVDLDGNILGRHDGISRFTIGQRRGLKLAAAAPLYVIHLDKANNRVIVGPRDALLITEITLHDVNWLGDQSFAALPGAGLEIMCKIRSTQAPVPARLFPGPDATARVELTEGELAVSPGQACVFYAACDNASRILGGGWIKRATGPIEIRLRSD